MHKYDFQIGDRCLFNFSGDKNVPVEVVGYYTPKEECVWVAPEDTNKRIPYAIDKTIYGRYTFAHISIICSSLNVRQKKMGSVLTSQL